jgi:hypothetical protein
MNEKQRQSAGENSQQIQVAGDLVLMSGVTESRAREIARAQAVEVVRESRLKRK